MARHWKDEAESTAVERQRGCAMRGSGGGSGARGTAWHKAHRARVAPRGHGHLPGTEQSPCCPWVRHIPTLCGTELQHCCGPCASSWQSGAQPQAGAVLLTLEKCRLMFRTPLWPWNGADGCRSERRKVFQTLVCAVPFLLPCRMAFLPLFWLCCFS